MENVTGRHGDPHVFGVDHGNGKRWLNARSGEAGYEWDGHYRFAFWQE
jgi:hypothetical protein